jgi:hypothetical protein
MDAPRTKLAQRVIATVGAKKILDAVAKAERGDGFFKIKVTSEGNQHTISAKILSSRHLPKR